MDEINNMQTLLSWSAPLRPYKKRSAIIIRFYLSVTLLLSFIIFFFGDKILLIPLWALLFLFYTLTITPPPDVKNKITKFGLEVAGVTLRWEVLSDFYFTTRFGYTVLTVVSKAPYYYHAYAVVPDAEIKKQLTLLLSEHLIFKEKPEKSFTDSLVDWLASFVPNEESQNGETKEAFASVTPKP